MGMKKPTLQNGFVQVPLIVRHDRKVKSGMLATYIAIKGHKNNGDPLGCFPGLDILAFETGFHKDTVSKHIQKLEELGHLKVIHRYNNSNIYSFPSEYKKCNCLELCNRTTIKKGIYMDFCIENIDSIKYDEEQLSIMFQNIYDKKPKVDDLVNFINEVEIARDLKKDKNTKESG